MVQKLLVSVAPPECLTPQWDGGTVKRRGESITRSTSQSLMVKPATSRVWARPSTDGLEASPITGNYYEDEYLMAQIIGALKGDAADVFDFACHHGKKHTKDLGLILEQMRHHYCGTLMFREQRNTIENMRQKSHESAANFLVRVSGAVDGLARDWKGVVSQHEIKALLSEVFINGVQEEFRHVLNFKMARYGKLTEDQMYNAVKRHEVYLGRTKCLRGGGTVPTTPQKSATLWASNNSFKP